MFAELLAKYVYGTDALQSESDRLDDARQAENLRDRERYGEAWYQETLKNDQGSRVNAEAEVAAEFKAPALLNNLEASASAAGKSVGGVAGSIVRGAGNFLGNTLLGFPGWFWVAGLAGAFLYFGGGNLIRAWVARKAN